MDKSIGSKSSNLKKSIAEKYERKHLPELITTRFEELRAEDGTRENCCAHERNKIGRKTTYHRPQDTYISKGPRRTESSCLSNVIDRRFS